MHTRHLHRRALLQTAAALAAASVWPARASTIPDKSVRLVIPFPAGGATDYAGRAPPSGPSAPDDCTLVMGIPADVSIAPHI